MKKERKITDRQQKFIDVYDGDVKASAKKAKISYTYARQLRTKTNIIQAIRNRQETELRPRTIMNRQERQEFWTQVVKNKKVEMRDRLRASELLGKSEADFTEKLAITSSDSLTDEECEEVRQVLRKNHGRYK
jgi:phage terminase small subunit